MKKTLRTLASIILISSTIFSSSCKKEATPEPIVLNGSNGMDGRNGIDGNANVKTKDFTLVFSQYVSKASFYMPAGSMDGKVTMVYIDKGNREWVLLPYLENVSGGVAINYTAKCSEFSDKIEITALRGDNVTGSPFKQGTEISFRAVVIEYSGL